MKESKGQPPFSCHKSIRDLRSRHKSSGGPDNDLDDSLRSFSRRLDSKRPPNRASACLRRCFCWRLLVAVAVIYGIVQSSRTVKHTLKTFASKHSYKYFLRPLRFVAIPLMQTYPNATKSAFRGHCIIRNPYYRYVDPPLAEDADDDDMPENCACRDVDEIDRIAVAPNNDAALDRLFSLQELHDGGVPRLLPNFSRGMTTEQFLDWYNEEKDTVPRSICMESTQIGEGNLDYDTPKDLVQRLQGDRRQQFYGATLMLCPGSAGQMAAHRLIRDLPRAADAGLTQNSLTFLSFGVRGVEERRTRHATPFDMTGYGNNHFIHFTLLVGTSLLRVVPKTCHRRCTTLEFEVSAGDSLLYNSSVWLVDQVIVNSHPTTCIAMTTAYAWEAGEDSWTQELDQDEEHDDAGIVHVR